MTRKTEQIAFQMELRRMDDNGYPEYFLIIPDSCDHGKLIKTVEAIIDVSPALAKKIRQSRQES